MSKKFIRLTEDYLHRIIKESVNNVLKENYFDFDGYDSILISDEILESNQAQEIAEDQNLLEEWMGAKVWFENIDVTFEDGEMPKYSRFIEHIDYIDADLYYDYGANYYFCVK